MTCLPAIQVHNLSFKYGERQILHELSFSVKPGECVTLIGASGAGKSTLFRLLTGILPRQTGDICFPVQEHQNAGSRGQVGYMMQEDLLLPWRTVIENITLPAELGYCPTPKQDRIDLARQLLSDIGLEGKESLLPHELSGGMRQRVSLARALLCNRDLLFLDEPFSSLDLCLREQMHTVLHSIQQRYGTTLLLITHDFRDAIHLSNRILLLQNGDFAGEWEVRPEVKEDPTLFGRFYNELRQALKEGAHA